MILYLMLFFALALSGVAAFYSIIGLMAIFAAAPIPIAVMGTMLEGSKLVVASWLYRNWSEIPRLMKAYLTSALVVLMFLTSMGIFGFLSKAHLDQGVPTSDIAAKVALIDEKIKTEKENVNAARQTIAQLDQQVNETINRTKNDTTNAGVNRSVTIRQQQAKERQALTRQIETSQAAIAKLNEERAPIASELRKVEAEVGPIKYIAALIYGDEATQDPTFLEKAVRWVTILIVAVFDPLAVVMLIAANWSLVRRRREVDHPSSDDDKPQSDPPPQDPPKDEFDISKHSYLTKPFAHFKNLKPMVASAFPSAVKDQITDSVTAPTPPVPEPEPPQPEPEATPDPVSRRVAERQADSTESFPWASEQPKPNPTLPNKEPFWRSRPKT